MIEILRSGSIDACLLSSRIEDIGDNDAWGYRSPWGQGLVGGVLIVVTSGVRKLRFGGIGSQEDRSPELHVQL